MSHWSFSASTSVVVFAIVIVAVSLYFSIRHWRSTAIRRRVLLLEAFRLLIIGLIVFTLLRPEWVEKIRRFKEAEIVVLYDASGSMKTRDVLMPDDKTLRREEWVDQRLKGKFWAPLERKYKVSLESFSSTPETIGSDESKDVEDGTDLNGALMATVGKHRSLRSIILLTDGDWNMGGPPSEAASLLRNLGVPVFAVPVGSDTYLPDLDLVDAKVPSFCLLNEHVSIPFRIHSHLSHDVRTKVTLLVGGRPEAEKYVVIPAQADFQDSLLWHATQTGTFNLSLRVPVEPDEKIKDNNEMGFTVAVRVEILKVLVVDSRPRWEYRFLRNALSRDPGVEVDCLLLHEAGMRIGGGRDYVAQFPESKEKLSRYDVVFLGDVGVGKNGLTLHQAELVKGLIEHQGSGLVFLPGIQGRELSLLKTPLAELMPVVLDTTKAAGIGSPIESKLLLTTYGKDHLLTLLADTPDGNQQVWRSLPGFYWHAAVTKARPNSKVLAVHGARRNEWGRIPLLVTRPFGSGNVLFMGTDSAWRWRRGVEDLYHYRFWGQVVRWMAHKRHMAYSKGLRLFYTPENPRVGDTVFLQVTAFDIIGYPIENARIFVDVSQGDEKVEQIELTAQEGGWGVYRGSFTPRAAGQYRLLVDCKKVSRQLEAKITVARRSREKIGQPARFNTLREIVRITGGDVGRPAELDALVKKIDALPRQVDLEKRIRLWAKWWWGGTIILLLAAYWVCRKFAGLV